MSNHTPTGTEECHHCQGSGIVGTNGDSCPSCGGSGAVPQYVEVTCDPINWNKRYHESSERVIELLREIERLKTLPLDLELRAVMRRISSASQTYEIKRPKQPSVVISVDDRDILLRAVQAQRLTGEDGVSMIAQERARQVAVEGWTPEHDAAHVRGELGDLAAYYCASGPLEWLESVVFPARWYMNAAKREGFPKPTMRDLVKAGALIAAEIDRRRAAFPEAFGVGEVNDA